MSRGRLLGALLAGLVAGLCACGPAPTGARSTASPAGSAAAASDPTPSSGPGAILKTGSTIEVHDYGFMPEWLIHTCCGPVTWVNDTSKPVRVVLPTLGLDSGALAPGGTYVWTPANPQAVGYYLDSTPRYWGKVQVD